MSRRTGICQAVASGRSRPITLSQRPVVILLGTGGVGKTTCSLLLAHSLAVSGKKVLLLTVDPARRLYDIIRKLDGLHGNLTVVKPDTQQELAGFVSRHSPDVETADRIKSSRFFPLLSDHLPALHEYVAADLILDAVDSGLYDHVVVDTPPFAYAVHFLEAPQRLARLAQSAHSVAIAGRSARKVSAGLLSPILERGLGRFLGRSFLAELISFISSFDLLWEDIAGSSKRGDDLFRTATTFGAVAVPDTHSTEDLHRLLAAAPSWMKLSFLILNRVLMVPPASQGTEHSLETLMSEMEQGETSRMWKRPVLESAAEAVLKAWSTASELAGRQQETFDWLKSRHNGLVERGFASLPLLLGGVRSVSDLERLASYLPVE